MVRLQFKIRTVMMVVALVALTCAALRTWLMDPKAARLPAGSMAVVDSNDSQPRATVAAYPLPLGGGRRVLLRTGTRVKILDDTRPSVINSFDEGGIIKRGEDRDVQIAVQDGKYAGFTGYTSRYYLQLGQ